MDPNAAHRNMLAIANELICPTKKHTNPTAAVEDACADGIELAELVLALDEWLTKGGFLPQRWERKQS